MTSARIIIAEDEAIVAVNLQLRLQSLGYEVLTIVDSGEEAVDQVCALRPDLVLMDIRLAGAMDGVMAAQAIRSTQDLPVVYLTAYTDDETVQRAKTTEPYGYLVKPFDARELHTAIVMALHKHVCDRQTRLRESWLTTLLHSIGEAVIATDATGNVTYLNPVAETLTGWSAGEAQGQGIDHVFRLVDATTAQLLANPVVLALREQHVVQVARGARLHNHNGQLLPIDASATPIRDKHGQILGMVVIFRDIREREHVQGQRWQREKLAVLAGMARGVAHEFSDLLTVILGSTSFASNELPHDSTLHPFIKLIETAARRAVELTGQLFTYSGEGRLFVEAANLNTLLEEVLDRRTWPPNIQVVRHLDAQLPALIVDSDQIRQVTTYLLDNAVEAIGENEGTIAVSTSIRNVSPEQIAASIMAPDLPPGAYAAFEIGDSGSGMSPTILERIFEPFFSTRPAGRGLGLPLALGMVASHHGLIDIASAPGQGTRVTVLLPLSQYRLH